MYHRIVLNLKSKFNYQMSHIKKLINRSIGIHFAIHNLILYSSHKYFPSLMKDNIFHFEMNLDLPCLRIIHHMKSTILHSN